MKDNPDKDAERRSWKVFAAWKCKALEASLPAKEEPHARRTLVQEAVNAARMRTDDDAAASRAIALNVVDLYGDDAELKTQVEQAHHLLDELKKPR